MLFRSCFICYAPADDPQIAVAVIIEKGYEGDRAAPIAKAVLKDDRIADYGPEKDGDGIRVLTIGRYDCAKFIKGIFGRQIEVTARPVTMEDAPMYAGKRAPLA